MPQLSFLLNLYRLGTTVLTPLAALVLRYRHKRGKEDGARLDERLGHASLPRPEGRLIWIHGASIGECVAALPLIDLLAQRLQARILVTSGTVTSAKVMARRLPAGAFHQFLPIDTPAATARFLDHWRPDVGLLVDSDVWPNLILAARARNIALAVVNARMSARSFAHWRRVHAKALFSCLAAVLAQNADEADRFRALGVADVRVIGSLKADAAALPCDATALEALKRQIGARPVFLAAQTHRGEEETLLPAIDRMRTRFPDLLSVIVPRHPDRGSDIVALCGDRATARRSLAQDIGPETAIYIADTIGEMGLFYRLAGFAFIGGSLIEHGGQNPLEPAKLKRAVLAGPHTFNFTAAYQAIFAAQGMGRVQTAEDIAAAAIPLLAEPRAGALLGEKAAAGAESLSGASAVTADFVAKLISHAHT